MTTSPTYEKQMLKIYSYRYMSDASAIVPCLVYMHTTTQPGKLLSSLVKSLTFSRSAAEQSAHLMP